MMSLRHVGREVMWMVKYSNLELRGVLVEDKRCVNYTSIYRVGQK